MSFYDFDPPYWMTRIMGTVALAFAVLGLLLLLLADVWEPFLGSVAAFVIFVPFTAWLEWWARP